MSETPDTLFPTKYSVIAYREFRVGLGGGLRSPCWTSNRVIVTRRVEKSPEDRAKSVKNIVFKMRDGWSVSSGDERSCDQTSRRVQKLIKAMGSLR